MRRLFPSSMGAGENKRGWKTQLTQTCYVDDKITQGKTLRWSRAGDVLENFVKAAVEVLRFGSVCFPTCHLPGCPCTHVCSWHQVWEALYPRASHRHPNSAFVSKKLLQCSSDTETNTVNPEADKTQYHRGREQSQTPITLTPLESRSPQTTAHQPAQATGCRRPCFYHG